MGNYNNTLTTNHYTDHAKAVEKWGELWEPGTYDPLTGLPDPIDDPENGGSLWRQQMINNAFNWQKDLLRPSIVSAANWWLEERRVDKLDEKFAEMRELSAEEKEEYIECVDSAMAKWEEFKPETPMAAEYIPIDCCEVYRDTILCNIGLMDQAEELVAMISAFHTREALVRMDALDPKYRERNDLVGCQVLALLEGCLPISDRMENFTDSCELAAMTAALGGACRTRRQDLGISELRAQREGFERHLALADYYQRISPVERLGDINKMLKDPKLAVDLDLTQAQLNQNSLQNKYNLAAIKDPSIENRTIAKLANCTTCLQAGLNAALLQNFQLPNYASIFQPVINGVATGISGAFGQSVMQNVEGRMQTPAPQYSPYDYGYMTGGYK